MWPFLIFPWKVTLDRFDCIYYQVTRVIQTYYHCFLMSCHINLTWLSNLQWTHYRFYISHLKHHLWCNITLKMHSRKTNQQYYVYFVFWIKNFALVSYVLSVLMFVFLYTSFCHVDLCVLIWCVFYVCSEIHLLSFKSSIELIFVGTVCTDFLKYTWLDFTWSRQSLLTGDS